MQSRHKRQWFEHLGSSTVAIVVAHQDDEVFFTSILVRQPRAIVVHVTDGAPRDETEWKGQSSRDAYATLRAMEARRALKVVEHVGTQIALGLLDGEAALHIEKMVSELRTIFRVKGVDVIFTHAYEGGHPDHDAVAKAVYDAAEGRTIVEAPFYRMKDGKSTWQTFVPVIGCVESRYALTTSERAKKDAMIRAHYSQRDALKKMSPNLEYFRLAPEYDFTGPPNGGNLSRNYSRIAETAQFWRTK